MSYFAVVREAGPAWSPGGIVDQPAVEEHAAFMNALAQEGFVLLAGPLGGSEAGRVRALLIVEAAGEAAVHARLADDPWTIAGRLRVVSIEPWTILAAEEHLAAALTA